MWISIKNSDQENLIGWKLEVGVASIFIQYDKGKKKWIYYQGRQLFQFFGLPSEKLYTLTGKNLLSKFLFFLE